MKIALINESSQATKNSMIYEVLKEAVRPYAHTIYNYGMSEENENYQINYVDAGLLSAILLNSKAVDFVITGCGSGEGACMATNIYPNVYCGYIKDASDAFLFTQINHGNAISLPFAKDFGWCSELNLGYIFHELFSHEHGLGYPKERSQVQKDFRNRFSEIKNIMNPDILQIQAIDKSILKNVISSNSFRKYFTLEAEASALTTYVLAMMED